MDLAVSILVVLLLSNLGVMALLGLILMAIREERKTVVREHQDIIKQLRFRLISQGGSRS